MKKIAEKNRNFISLIVLLLFWSLAVSSSSSKSTFSNGSYWIPDDFNPSKTILLIQKFEVRAKTQGKMEDFMAEKYPYKYEFVPLKTIQNREGKYANTKLYKYALVYSSSNYNSFDVQTGRSGVTTTSFDFNFFDRENNKHYNRTGKGSSYAIQTFMPVINTIIAKFQ